VALVVALGLMIVLTTAAAAAFEFTTSTTRATAREANTTYALHYAEGGVNAAYSVLSQTLRSGSNPTDANLLGCAGATGATDKTGPSNCATVAPRVYCLDGASTCTAEAASTASVFGYFSGTSAGSYGGVPVPASSWLLVSTGYGWNPATQTVVAKTLMSIVKVNPLGAGAVAAVWNHVFITSPLTPNVCSLSFSGNSVTITTPLYVIGNLCLGSGGTGGVVKETTQPVDLEVGGKLVLSGGSSVGADSQHGITSGVVVGGCTTVSVSSATTSCNPTGFKYWVKKSEAFVDNNAPTLTAADIAAKYAGANPGPKHACAAGGTLSSTAFDNDSTQNASASSFELTPGSSYTCVSTSGSSTGQLSWNNSTKVLTVQGTLFFDGNVTISQTAKYVGTAVLYAAGKVTFNGNATALCATSPCNTSATAWQGSSSNTSMLTLAALAANTQAITFTNNSQTFQGSLWTQPSSSMTFVKNGVTVEGPMSIGTFDASFNNATLIPLPVIKNMPAGAPLPPNSSASLGDPIYQN